MINIFKNDREGEQKMRSNLEKIPVAQLAHVELLTTKLNESLWFFKEVLGLEEVERSGNSISMRAYEDFYHHSLKLTEADEPGLGHMAWRTSSEEVLEICAKELEEAGVGLAWIDGDIGHGRAYRFQTPDGHQGEILWDVDY